MARIVLLNKPYGYLSQFTPEGRWRGLGDLLPVAGVYPAGRLDADSEGLLVLTDSGALQARIAHPRHKLVKTYLAQVEGEISEAALAALRAGVSYADFTTRPCEARRIAEPAWLWPRQPPVRFRRQIPTSWVEIRLAEGKNRQVRRMTAHVGFPTLRLIRQAVGALGLGDLPPGSWRQLIGDYANFLPAGANAPSARTAN